MENELQVLCPFCNTIQPSEVVAELDAIHAGCITCGHGSSVEIAVEVFCPNCRRVIYRKEATI